MIQHLKNTSLSIKKKAIECGFDFAGFSKAEKLDDQEMRLRQWLDSGYQGKMDYLEKHFALRLDIRELMPEAKSVISLLYNHYPSEELSNGEYKIAKYAYGKDYHKVIKKRVKPLTACLEELFPNIRYRVFVDSAPVMERQWAAKAGLGWIGKNTLLINKDKGSFFFIAVILVDVELEYDAPIRDYCGSCTKCLDACPTDAFPQPYVLDASKCISYATIELKDALIPGKFKEKMENWVFGCDICQDVCPWNRFSTPHNEPAFSPKDELLVLNKDKWEKLTEEEFNHIFEGSALKRTKFNGLKRNIQFVKGD